MTKNVISLIKDRRNKKLFNANDLPKNTTQLMKYVHVSFIDKEKIQIELIRNNRHDDWGFIKELVESDSLIYRRIDGRLYVVPKGVSPHQGFITLKSFPMTLFTPLYKTFNSIREIL